ncbi:MAG: hypothetical protein Kow0042_00530 [Calditrichia bacterium]
MVRGVYSNLDLFITAFNVKNLTKKDNPDDARLLWSLFVEYIKARNHFREVFYRGTNLYTPKSNNYLFMEVTVIPDHTVNRTWILDLPFFYPFVGYWPLTPQ